MFVNCMTWCVAVRFAGGDAPTRRRRASRFVYFALVAGQPPDRALGASVLLATAYLPAVRWSGTRPSRRAVGPMLAHHMHPKGQVPTYGYQLDIILVRHLDVVHSTDADRQRTLTTRMSFMYTKGGDA